MNKVNVQIRGMMIEVKNWNKMFMYEIVFFKMNYEKQQKKNT